MARSGRRLIRSDEAVIPPRADLTGDGVVDSNDVARLVADFGPASHTEQRRARSASEGLEPSSPSTPPSPVARASRLSTSSSVGRASRPSLPSDLNRDGLVDAADLRILLTRLGQPTPTGLGLGFCEEIGCITKKDGSCFCGGDGGDCEDGIGVIGPGSDCGGGGGDSEPDNDIDEDGVDDSEDNCPNTFNPGQSDSGGGGVGDACDGCPFDPTTANPENCDGQDSDGDGSDNDTGGNGDDGDGGELPPPPPPPAPCEASIEGPAFVAVNAPASFTVSLETGGGIDSVEWAAPVGAEVEVDPDSTTTSTLSLTAGPDPSAVTLAATVTTSDNDTCMADHNFVIGQVEFLDASMASADFLDIGHWGADVGNVELSGYDPNHNLINGAGEVFIDTDPDRFFLRIKDPSANENDNAVEHVQVDLATLTGAVDDGSRPITLIETGPETAVFKSEALLLMSPDLPAGDNPDDDVEVWSDRAGGFVGDDQTDDRTHRASIDGEVEVNYVAGNGAQVSASVPVTQREPEDIRRVLRVRVRVHLEPFNDVGYVNTMPDETGGGNGQFDWDDENGNGVHEPGERSEPYADFSRLHEGQPSFARGDIFPNDMGDGWGRIAPPEVVAAQMERANLAWAQAGVKVIQEGPTIVEQAPLVPDPPNNAPWTTIIHDGWFDTNGIGGVDGEITAETIGQQASFDVLEVVFTTAIQAPGAGDILGVAIIPSTSTFLPPDLRENTYVFIGTDDDTPIINSSALDVRMRTLAHEIGHALTNRPDSDANPRPPYIYFLSFADGPTNLDDDPEGRRRIRHSTEFDARTEREPGVFGGIGNRLLVTPQ